MRKTFGVYLLTCILCLSSTVYASLKTDYFSRFMAYLQWSEHLPVNPDPDFIAFIDSDTRLAQKLREKWLYQLAHQKDWQQYLKHYRASKDVRLQCFALLAQYHLGREASILHEASQLWLSGESQPAPCGDMFNVLLKNGSLSERLITQRIELALDKRNVKLASYLLRQYKPPRLEAIDKLEQVYQHPSQILNLHSGPLESLFYLFGLKQMVYTQMDKAILFWKTDKTKHMLNDAQQQAFLAHLVLYKAIRNHDDTVFWFRKIKPAYYNDLLLDWQIRHALKHQQWLRVERLIHYSKDKDSPCWQYWLARSLEARGKKDEAKGIYEALAKSRQYYGFLASFRLKKNYHFENEAVPYNKSVLKPYRPFTDNIKMLYLTKQSFHASQLLNDFFLDLPKKDKSALANWIAQDLQWHAKSVNLSNTEELTNQLNLRFPLIYRGTINGFSNAYHIPQALIYAIIRQESAFREDVVSVAGARGLMQLMPATARVVAKREKIAYRDKAQLFFSPKNINIGVAYLKELARRYRYHPLLIAAAYNAGPHQVNVWLKNSPVQQIDIWIETLPWQETRNYLKNIIAFYAVYQYRMRMKPDLRVFMRPI